MAYPELDLKYFYDSGLQKNNVLQEFYIPVLQETTSYDRVAGYFSSRVFASAARGIAGIVRNKGKMRLITSHAFTKNDTSSLKEFFDSETFVNELANEFVESFKKLGTLSDSIVRDHAAAMCWMLREGYLEVRVIIPKNANLVTFKPEEIEKFHPKFGIFTDAKGNRIAFSGSVNETESAWVRNIENFDVFKSWEVGQNSYIDPKVSLFERYWNNDLDSNWKTIDLPSAVKEKIILECAPDDFPQSVLEESVPTEKSLRPYQESALNAWISSERKGILEMATGTGKTRTAKACIQNAMEQGSLCTLIVVPYHHISEQWLKELSNLNPVQISGDWKSKLREIELDASLGRIENLTLVAVKNTAGKESFVEILAEINRNFTNFLLVADEVHWLGAPAFRASLVEFANFRLGLSATPKRYFDDYGTKILTDYFNGSVFELPISEALKLRDPSGNPILCPYEYFPILVDLTEDEFNQYKELTQRIARLSSQETTPENQKILDELRILRANVAKSAENKIPALRSLLKNLDKPITQTLIYCSNTTQLELAAEVLNEFGIHSQKITGDESAIASKKYNYVSEREHIISNFAKGNLDVLLSMECLDEGVDIPSAKMGIILASSGNEKEFIQRRGRLMRPFPGKENATIYDMCIVPKDVKDPVKSLNLVKVELDRLSIFAQDSLNPELTEDIIAKSLEENDGRH